MFNMPSITAQIAQASQIAQAAQYAGKSLKSARSLIFEKSIKMVN